MHDDTELTYGTAETVALTHTPQIGDLVTALAKAQQEMDNPETDGYNPFFKSRYATMAATRNATIPHLAKHGIATTQHPELGQGWVRCTTVLWCGEQYLKSTLQCKVVKTRRDGGSGQVIPVTELNHQDYTAVFSYIRRVSLQAVCNIAGEEDDDGNQGAGKGTETGQRTGKTVETNQRRREAGGETRMATADQRQILLAEIWDLYKEAIQPLKHAGMHKAIFHASFELEKPELITEQVLDVLVKGMPIYRHLTAQLLTWDKTSKPDVWIRDQLRTRDAASAENQAVPEGIDPETGEDLRDMPDGWLTEEEQREQRERDEAALLAQANA